MKWDYGLVWFWLAYAGVHIIGNFNWFGFIIGLGSMFWTARKVRRELDHELAQSLRS